MSSSHSRRLRQAIRIFAEGFEVMPCSLCRSRGLRCRMLKGHSKCGECTRRGRTCDGTGVVVSTCECDACLGDAGDADSA